MFFKNFLSVIDIIKFRKKDNMIEIIEVEKFDESFDEFFNKISSKIGISSYKDSAYLNWKYVDRPFNLTKIFAAVQNNKNKGYIVLGPYPKETN